MKKVSYIVFGLVFLALASCQKEVVCPNGPARNASEIEWKSSNTDMDKSISKGRPSNDKAFNDNSGTNTNSGNAANSNDNGNEDSGITDPNNDPDAAKKKGKK